MSLHPNSIRTMFKKGHKHSPEVLKRMSDAQIARYKKTIPVNLGKKLSEETKKRLKQAWLKNRDKRSGANHWKYNKNRKEVDLNKRRYWSTEYRQWRTAVFVRDGYRCKISNEDCCAYVEAHHILSWKDYPDLRFNINNGITLCRVHHPRKRDEEKRLSPYFQELVSVSNG